MIAAGIVASADMYKHDATVAWLESLGYKTDGPIFTGRDVLTTKTCDLIEESVFYWEEQYVAVRNLAVAATHIGIKNSGFFGQRKGRGFHFKQILRLVFLVIRKSVLTAYAVRLRLQEQEDIGMVIIGRLARPEEENRDLPVAFVPHARTCGNSLIFR